MNIKAFNYLQKNRVGCLAVTLPDGAPHAATVHYSDTTDPLVIYIQTGKGTKKGEALSSGEALAASFVVGFSEEEWITLQLDGKARLLKTDEEIAQFQTTHYAKNPEAEKHAGSSTAYIEFRPTWYRFSDFNTEPVTSVEEEL